MSSKHEYNETLLNLGHDLSGLKETALKWVNEQRVVLGGAPIDSFPKGRPRCNFHCVIANAFSDLLLGVSVGIYINGYSRHNGHNGYDVQIKIPAEVFVFYGEFDNLAYPELIDEHSMKQLVLLKLAELTKMTEKKVSEIDTLEKLYALPSISEVSLDLTPAA